MGNCTESQKKVPTCKLSVILINLKLNFKIFALLESLWNLLRNPYDIARHTLGMLLQYLGKSKFQISAAIQPIWKKMQACCILIASNFVIHPQILIFLVLKNGVSFPILIANKIFHVIVLLVIYFCNQFMAPKIHHSRRHCSVCGIQRRGQDLNKKFVFEGVHSKEVDRWISWETLDKAWC